MKRFGTRSAMILGMTLVAGCLDHELTAPTAPTADRLAADVGQLESAALQKANELMRIAAEKDGGIAELSKRSTVVSVPAGSVDALAAAIAQAGDRGVVVLEAGLHQESGTVVVDRPVLILGEPGAILQVDTQPVFTDTTPIDPALHVLGASNVMIWGLAIRPFGPIGGVGILLEDSPGATVGFNTLDEHQYSVVAEQADGVAIVGNTIHCSAAWQVGTIGESHGVIISNAEHATIVGNSASDGLFGYWPCDKKGVLMNNTATACYIGIILCKVPMGLVLPDGDVTGAEFSATQWLCKSNQVSDCFDANYIVIDGANKNVVMNNESSNPGTYDIELVGDSYRFGFLTPTSFDNTVIVGDDNLVVKDCGLNNTVIGGTLVDNATDPCF